MKWNNYTNTSNLLIKIKIIIMMLKTTTAIIIIVIIIATIKIIMIINKGDRREKEREIYSNKRAIMYYYSTVTSKISNAVTFTNHIFSPYILHKAKIQHYTIVFLISRK